MVILTAIFAIIEVAIAAILATFGAMADTIFFFVVLLAVPYCFTVLDSLLAKYRRRTRWKKRHQNRRTVSSRAA